MKCLQVDKPTVEGLVLLGVEVYAKGMCNVNNKNIAISKHFKEHVKTEMPRWDDILATKLLLLYNLTHYVLHILLFTVITVINISEL